MDHVPVHTYYQPDFKTDHDSLVHMWNDWYQQYMNASFPVLIVRFEDLLFHGEEVTNYVCKCAGGTIRRTRFRHAAESTKEGKSHGKDKTGLVSALIKYGNNDHRLDSMNAEDLKYAAKHLDQQIMDPFGYTVANT